MDDLIPCATLQRLRKEYEVAVRVWGELEFPLHNAPLETENLRISLLQRKQPPEFLGRYGHRIGSGLMGAGPFTKD